MPQKKTTKRALTAKLAVAAEAVLAEAVLEIVGDAGIVSSTTNGNVESVSPAVGDKTAAAAVGRGRKKRKGVAAENEEIENVVNEKPSTSALAVDANNTDQGSAANTPTPAKRGRKKAAPTRTPTPSKELQEEPPEVVTKSKKGKPVKATVIKKVIEKKVVAKPAKAEKGRKKKVEEPVIDDEPMEEVAEEIPIPKKRGRKPQQEVVAVPEVVPEPDEDDSTPTEEGDEIEEDVEEYKPTGKKAPKKRTAAAAKKKVAAQPTPTSPKAATSKKTKKELKPVSATLSPTPPPPPQQSPAAAATQKATKAQSKKVKADAKGKKNNNAVDGGKTSKEKAPRSHKGSGDKKEEDEDSSKGKSSSKDKKTPLNSINTIYNKADFELAKDNANEKDLKNLGYNLKISSWNVAGLRSWIKKDGLVFLDYEQPDIFCIQETKCTTDLMPEEAERIPGYHPYWLCMPGGYAGVAIYSKIMPINIEYGIGDPEHDVAGRIITAEYEKFYLICVYVPNSGRKLVNLESRMRWEIVFQKFVKNLDAKKPVIICGDMNVSHQEIDLANPKANTRSAGFTKEEREQFTKLLSFGFVDTFRYLYPKRKGAYTYWTYLSNARSRNVGWRLDYFIVSERLAKRVVDNCIRSQVLGSDHCPITLFLKL